MAKKKEKEKKEEGPPELQSPKYMYPAQLAEHITRMSEELERERSIREDLQRETNHFWRAIQVLKLQTKAARNQLAQRETVSQGVKNRFHGFILEKIEKARQLLTVKMESYYGINIDNKLEVLEGEAEVLKDEKKRKEDLIRRKFELGDVRQIYGKAFKHATISHSCFKSGMEFDYINFMDISVTLQEKKIHIILEKLGVQKRADLATIQRRKVQYDLDQIRDFEKEELIYHNYYKAILNRGNALIDQYMVSLRQAKNSRDFVINRYREVVQKRKEMTEEYKSTVVQVEELREKVPPDKSYLNETKRVKNRARKLRSKVQSLEGEVEIKRQVNSIYEVKCLEHWDAFSTAYSNVKQNQEVKSLLLLRKKDYLEKKLEFAGPKKSASEADLTFTKDENERYKKLVDSKDMEISDLQDQIKYVCFYVDVMKKIYAEKLREAYLASLKLPALTK